MFIHTNVRIDVASTFSMADQEDASWAASLSFVVHSKLNSSANLQSVWQA